MRPTMKRDSVVQPRAVWTLATAKKPPVGATVLVYGCRGGEYGYTPNWFGPAIGEWGEWGGDDGWFVSDNHRGSGFKVTHWMTIPPSPLELSDG